MPGKMARKSRVSFGPVHSEIWARHCLPSAVAFRLQSVDAIGLEERALPFKNTLLI